jgi:stage V sporulation protein R
VEVLKGKGKYELYPGNPYETVINTRPPISFYNDNNPDWLNVMIFYHVLGHIDFFQNNTYFQHTHDYDFTGEALSDKRLIARLRSEQGRWVDYIIEFARGIDNLVAFHGELSRTAPPAPATDSGPINYYFDVFLQSVKNVNITEYIKEIERYNHCRRDYGKLGEETFLSDTEAKYPEFKAIYQKSLQKKQEGRLDLLKFLMLHSDFLNREENEWMKSILQVVRKTSLFFQPQIRTKIMNEGWASYWHEVLFMADDRIRGHEVDFARINASVTALPRVGLNPYALGMRMFYYIEKMADRGKYTMDFNRLKDARERDAYDAKLGIGQQYIFDVRRDMDDFLFVKTFVDQAFVDTYRLFVVGKRMNATKMVWEYYVKSRRAEDYQEMLIDGLYHPPSIDIDLKKTDGKVLYLVHRFEGKPLVKDYIANTMLGIEYLWGGPVKLETSEVARASDGRYGVFSGGGPSQEKGKAAEIKWQRILYSMEKRHLTRRILYDMEDV